MDVTFEFLPEPEIVIMRAPEDTPLQTLTLASVALSKLAHAYDYGHTGESAQIPERWALITDGVAAALEDPAEFYEGEGNDPARAAVLGARLRLAMRHSAWGVPEDERRNRMAITSTQGIPQSEFPTLVCLATLVGEAAERLKGKVSAESLRVQSVTREVLGEEDRTRRWAGLLAARLDRPDLLEVETREVLLTSVGALVDGHPEIGEWIPRNRDPSVRIREPRNHPGLPLIVTPFVMESEAAWEAVGAGGVVDRAFVEASPTVEALRAELARGPAGAS